MFDDLRDLYQEVILDHGQRPRHARRLESFDATAKGDNPMCGDRLQLWVQYQLDGGIAIRSGFVHLRDAVRPDPPQGVPVLVVPID